MEISVVIVSWNARRYLEQCLTSLVKAPAHRSTEILVVDNASTDGSAEMVEASFPVVKVIRNRENLGFAKANNLAIGQCRGRYISLINSDVTIMPRCLDALAEFLDQNPRVGNAGPRVLNGDLSQQSSCRRFPTIWNNLCSALGFAAAFKHSRLFSGEHMLYFAHDRTRCVDVLVGCFWMMRAEAIDAVGPLDEDFFMYGEDVDWCRRCWGAGWQVVFFPDAQAIHYRGGSSANNPVDCAVAQQRSLLHYWSKHHGKAGVAGIRAILFCHHLLRCLFGVISRYLHSSKPVSNTLTVAVNVACLQRLLSRQYERET